MHIKTVLNKCHKFKSFVYEQVEFVDKSETLIEVKVVARANAKAVCSYCGESASLYDRLGVRRFEFIPLWGYRVFFVYIMRRVNCPSCGVTVERVPWGSGKRELTTTYMQFLAHWGRKLSWQEVAETFRTSWPKVFCAVEYMVEWGLKERELSGITAIGIDEVSWSKGHKYLTLVYQIDSHCTRLLWIGRERTVETLSSFFHFLGESRSQSLRYICSDMWKPYLRVIAEKAGQAIHILDRFHIVAMVNKALDEVRAEENRIYRLCRGLRSLARLARLEAWRGRTDQTSGRRVHCPHCRSRALYAVRGGAAAVSCRRVLRARLTPLRKSFHAAGKN